MEEDLYGVLLKAQGEANPLPPAVIDRKIRAAEDWYEHALHIFFGERRVVSNPQGRGIAPANYDVAVPALDYTRDLFADEQWGWLDLHYRPIVSISEFFFSYPGTGFAKSFDVPLEWLQVDYKYGTVRMVPTTGPAVMVTFNAWVMSVLAGGRGLPRSIYVDYVAGLSREALLTDHQDLLEAVRIRACLLVFGIASTIRAPGLASQSLSLDGLSRSQSFGQGKWGPYSGVIEMAMAREQEILRAWRDAERGIPLMVV